MRWRCGCRTVTRSSAPSAAAGPAVTPGPHGAPPRPVPPDHAGRRAPESQSGPTTPHELLRAIGLAGSTIAGRSIACGQRHDGSHRQRDRHDDLAMPGRPPSPCGPASAQAVMGQVTLPGQVGARSAGSRRLAVVPSASGRTQKGRGIQRRRRRPLPRSSGPGMIIPNHGHHGRRAHTCRMYPGGVTGGSTLTCSGVASCRLSSLLHALRRPSDD